MTLVHTCSLAHGTRQTHITLYPRSFSGPPRMLTSPPLAPPHSFPFSHSSRNLNTILSGGFGHINYTRKDTARECLVCRLIHSNLDLPSSLIAWWGPLNMLRYLMILFSVSFCLFPRPVCLSFLSLSFFFSLGVRCLWSEGDYSERHR